MPLRVLKNSTAASVAGGCGLATGFYAVSSMLLTGSFSTFLPTLGAIALAGITPALILNGRKNRGVVKSDPEMSQRFEALNRHASINIVNEKDKLTEVNEKFLELTGYSHEELIGEPINILFGTAGQEVRQDIRRNLKLGKTWSGETPILCKDGSTVYTQSTIMPLFDNNGNWAGSISARTDVTKTNKLIAERHTAQTLYELHDDIWIIDSDTETFSYMNRAAKERLNIDDGDYLEKSLEELDCEGNIDGVLDACRKLRLSGDSSTQLETTFMGVPADVSIKFLHEAGGPARYLILFNDITDRIEQEKRKTAFISNISHELRSPMTSIKGAMGLLLSGSTGELPDKALSLLEIAHRNADRLVLIVNDMLDMDKISNGQMDFDIKDVDLSDLVSETDQANMMLRQRFAVKTELIGTDTPVNLHTDPNRIIQVLTNLLSNAYKFSKPNSRILISVDDEPDHVRVAVQDEGPGIPQDEQHKIFDRFADMTNSDRKTKGGTGLGLNICKAIIENLGGTIGFETEEGVGSTFYFTLPKEPAKDVSIKVTDEKRVA
ncbi:MAG: PAS domain-containing sensor histidine kinase [Sulfitobacter sp.]